MLSSHACPLQGRVRSILEWRTAALRSASFGESASGVAVSVGPKETCRLLPLTASPPPRASPLLLPRLPRAPADVEYARAHLWCRYVCKQRLLARSQQ